MLDWKPAQHLINSSQPSSFVSGSARPFALAQKEQLICRLKGASILLVDYEPLLLDALCEWFLRVARRVYGGRAGKVKLPPVWQGALTLAAPVHG